MKKRVKVFLFCIIFLMDCVLSEVCTGMMGTVHADSSISDIVDDTCSYIRSCDSNPGFGSEWSVVGQARGGKSLSDNYFQLYYQNFATYLEEQKGVLSTTKATEYARAIVGLTSIGIDAQDVAGYNLFDKISTFSFIKKQGLNGVIWTLIAVNASPSYTFSPEGNVSDSDLVDYILGQQLSDGGWAYSGSSADPDMTAMAIQALSFYQGQSDVKAAIDDAVECLSELQQSDGGFKNSGTLNSESCSEVVTALCSVGIDPDTDSRFIKTGTDVNNVETTNSALDNLLLYYVSGSGFSHVNDGVPNALASDEACYALAAYQRFKAGKTNLYDMSDVSLSSGEKVTSEEEEEEEEEEEDDTEDPTTTVKKDTSTKKDTTKKKTTDNSNNSNTNTNSGTNGSTYTSQPVSTNSATSGTGSSSLANRSTSSSSSKSTDDDDNSLYDDEFDDSDDTTDEDDDALYDDEFGDDSDEMIDQYGMGGGWNYVPSDYIEDPDDTSGEDEEPYEPDPLAQSFGILYIMIVQCFFIELINQKMEGLDEL